MIGINVKWNKESYENVQIPINQGAKGIDLKRKLSEVTGVPVDRQKVMGKGIWKGLLEDDLELSGLPFKSDNKSSVVMMGTLPEVSETIGKAPTDMKVVFVEELNPKAVITTVGNVLPTGLENLGNTCYLNSTLQPLSVIPELSSALESFESSIQQHDISDQLVDLLRGLFHTLASKKAGLAYSPRNLVGSIRLAFPQFNQRGPASQGGGFVQHDSDEFYGILLNLLAQKLSENRPSTRAWRDSFVSDLGLVVSSSSSQLSSNAIDCLFGIQTTNTMVCLESDAEPPLISTETTRRLQCTINEKIDFLESGLALGFEDEREKFSDVLQRNAKWKMTRRVSQLPKYLVIQMNRFFWKLTPQSQDHQGVNCKILRPVTFPLNLDMFTFCTDELKSLMKEARERNAQEMLVKSKKIATDELSSSSATSTSSIPMEEEENDEEVKRALAMSLENTKAKCAGFGLAPSFQGVYELFAVVTHIGRSSNSGHYMSWVKQAPGKWVVFDDDHASECTDDEILNLKGGGDDHMAYQLYYRAKF